MIIYAISGLGADKRVFSHLNLDIKIICIEWIKPLQNENIENYAKRLIDKYNIRKEDYLLGVSFGGLIAVEISKLLNTELVILISSAKNKNELRKLYKLIGKTKILELIPKELFIPPKFIAKWLFSAKNKQLLFDIISDTDKLFAKWCLNKLTQWNNLTKINNCIKINGDKDKLIPITKDSKPIIIKGGGHFMIVDKADEISKIINNKIYKNNLP